MSALSADESASAPDALTTLRDALRQFALERDWDQFHNPKSLACALSVEAAELLEPFQWLSEPESAALPPQTLEHVRQEVADVFLYLIRLADKLGIDLVTAAQAKIEVNSRRYPVAQARGTRRKYTEL
jgi:NTP pyrophosphatase (non-canonical NTP hydrolase)